MILFYSNACPSCQMLLEQIERYKVKNHFKLVNVEKVLSKGLKLPDTIHSVPSLMLMPQRQVFVGKPLFDYLLLPNKGLLFRLNDPQKASISDTAGTTSQISSEEPAAYGFLNQSSEMFSFISDENTMDPHIHRGWSSLQEEQSPVVVTSESSDKETKSKKNLPDVSALRAERDLDIQNYLNNSSVPPAVV